MLWQAMKQILINASGAYGFVVMTKGTKELATTWNNIGLLNPILDGRTKVHWKVNIR